MEFAFSRRFLGIFTALLLALSGALAFGQGVVTGSINGTVEDQQKAVITGAAVTAVNTGTNVKYTAQTNNTGYFNIGALPVGTYNLTVEAPKFSKLNINGIAVNASQPTSLGARAMTIGSETTVVVESAAPLVQTDSMNVAGTFNTKKVADLPLGNGFDAFALFTPGVVDTAQANFSNANGPGLSANGQRGRSNNYELDGQSNNDNSVAGPSIFFGNQDAIQEVQVLTSYDAQYGRNMGSVVNYVTKTGTNAFHGTGYEIYNGNWADSMGNQERNPTFGNCIGAQTPQNTLATGSPCTTPTVPRYVDNRFGGTMGGPIWRDKLWFFGSGNFERQRVGSTLFSSGTAATPTLNGLAALAAAFPNNAAVSALKAVGPTAVTAGGTPTFHNLVTKNECVGAVCVPVEFGEVDRPLQSIFNDYEGTGRVDYQVTPKDHFFGRYIFQQTISTNVGISNTAGGGFVNEPGRSQQIGLDEVHTFGPSLVNQARFSYSRTRFFFEGGAYPTCTSFAIPNCPTNVSFTSGTDLGFGPPTNIPQGRLINVTSYQDNATWIWGKNTIKFGGEYDRQRSPNVFLPDISGAYSFRSFGNFLANTPSSATVALGIPTDNFKENDVALYAQDDWRVKDNLTLTLGLRWEWDQQAINLLHDLTTARESNPATALYNTALPLNLRTVPEVPNVYNNFGPVIGFSYTPRFLQSIFGQDKTIIRGGFRIAYDPEFYNMFLNVATSTPNVDLTSVNCTNCFPASGNGQDASNALKPFAPLGGNPGLARWTTVANDFHNPYTEQWNLGIQREITHGIVAEVRYVGNHDIGQFQDINGNPAIGQYIKEGFGSIVPSGLVPCAIPGSPGFKAGYQDCTKTRVLERANTGFSEYNSLQTELRTSNFHGVTAGLAYTYSHLIDNSNEVFNPGANQLVGFAYPQNPFNVSAGEKSNADIDYPNVTTLYMLYDTPWFKNQSGWKGRLLGGWEINPIYRFTSGEPYTVVQSRFVGNGAGAGGCDPTGTFSTANSACNPFLSNANAAIATVGVFCDAAFGNCVDGNGNAPLVAAPTGTLVSLYDPCFSSISAAGCSFTPIANNSVHWIANTAEADKIFGTLFGARRNLQRGDPVNNMNLAVLKTVKINERLNMQLRAVMYNVTNSSFLGTPDPFIDDGAFNPSTLTGSFANTHFNNSGAFQFNSVFNGIDRRRLEVGAKLIF